MNISDIITLTQAGWTKDEIMNIMNGSQSDLQPEQSEQQPQPEQPEQQPQPEQPEQLEQYEGRFKSLETKLDYVINRFNYMAVQNSQQPAQQTESVDDILSSLVRGSKQE